MPQYIGIVTFNRTLMSEVFLYLNCSCKKLHDSISNGSRVIAGIRTNSSIVKQDARSCKELVKKNNFIILCQYYEFLKGVFDLQSKYKFVILSLFQQRELSRYL